MNLSAMSVSYLRKGFPISVKPLDDYTIRPMGNNMRDTEPENTVEILNGVMIDLDFLSTGAMSLE